MRAAQSPLASTQFFVLCVFCVQRASYLSIVDGALNPVSLCDLDQPMLKEVMAENRGPVSHIPTSTHFTNRVHIKCRGYPTLWWCSMVCIVKNIANRSQNPPISPCHVCVVPTCPQNVMAHVVCDVYISLFLCLVWCVHGFDSKGPCKGPRTQDTRTTPHRRKMSVNQDVP